MKFLPDAPHGPTITAYGPGWISVNGQRHEGHALVHSVSGITPWECPGYEQLQGVHFEPLASLKPELILFGSGDTLRFPRPEWLQSLYALRIGVETMDTAAACRTYNFLSGEGRIVLAALLL
jgi:uncharacterized protein